MCDRQFLIFRFLSTPSGWRATFFVMFVEPPLFVFLSTPSGWRATGIRLLKLVKVLFLSTPSGWRATTGLSKALAGINKISIHALRVEGDTTMTCATLQLWHFYPRPPGGGRPSRSSSKKYSTLFLSTPSGWRATASRSINRIRMRYFYPRPPGGGRLSL